MHVVKFNRMANSVAHVVPMLCTVRVFSVGVLTIAVQSRVFGLAVNIVNILCNLCKKGFWKRYTDTR